MPWRERKEPTALTSAVSGWRRTRVDSTLTGPPGIGKTRLAQELARLLETEFDDGACFVALAPIRDPALLAPTIAQMLGLKLPGEQAALDLLKPYLANRSLLLVLDNFEQIVAAGLAIMGVIGMLFKDKAGGGDSEVK